jgi:hypothetical protein
MVPFPPFFPAVPLVPFARSLLCLRPCREVRGCIRWSKIEEEGLHRLEIQFYSIWFLINNFQEYTRRSSTNLVLNSVSFSIYSKPIKDLHRLEIQFYSIWFLKNNAILHIKKLYYIFSFSSTRRFTNIINSILGIAYRFK